MFYSKCIALGKHRYTKPDTRFTIVHIKADLLHSLKWTLQSILSRKHSKYNYTEVKIHIPHILLQHHIGKRTNTLLPPFLLLSLCLSYWPNFFAAVCEKRGKRKDEQHMAISSHSNILYHAGTDHRAQSEKQIWLFCETWDIMYCTRIFEWEYLCSR